jgi:hypothetical protein
MAGANSVSIVIIHPGRLTIFNLSAESGQDWLFCLIFYSTMFKVQLIDHPGRELL